MNKDGICHTSIEHPGMRDEPLTEAELDRDINEDVLETIEIDPSKRGPIDIMGPQE